MLSWCWDIAASFSVDWIAGRSGGERSGRPDANLGGDGLDTILGGRKRVGKARHLHPRLRPDRLQAFRGLERKRAMLGQPTVEYALIVRRKFRFMGQDVEQLHRIGETALVVSLGGLDHGRRDEVPLCGS